ncbi:hypothetical protein KGM_203977 [Danaus plexippus plexippus]|uniref:Uncharacterized protein n=1 Tax=Danaus plexippus plexippus TaxID=278856 RepID=A0A212F9P9_DANPL|nr:pollen-specific leucine-rich repeat extensin-like protein 3 [Danaus plexippus plexippus]OWR50466.1 hypothetical protein KGM_203977 [Danaus plexippus plexippus]
MLLLNKNFLLLLFARSVLGTISGLSYMDTIRFNPQETKPPDENSCNPLYWYPRNIPEYCYFKPPVISITTESTHSSCATDRILPPLIPVPPPPIYPVPPILPLPPPMVPGLPSLPIAPPIPYNIFQPPLVPIQPPQMSYDHVQLQPPHYPYPIQGSQAGFMPGLPGLVTRNGGINIMPFSDAYADMLEKHKNKVIRKKLQRIIHKYEYLTNSRRNL